MVDDETDFEMVDDGCCCDCVMVERR